MKQTFLETAEDLAWLTEVHSVTTGGLACAILHGNEDSPSKVETFARNHMDCVPSVWIQDRESGKLALRIQGERRASESITGKTILA
jgi:hypothetical protein